MIGRALTVAWVTCVLLAGTASTARAHGDAGLVDGTVTVPAHGSATFEAELHYHRLTGRVSADRPVRVRALIPSRDSTPFEAGPARRMRFNVLIRCCERAWTPLTLVIENPGATDVRVAAEVRLVHDDLAVSALRAESGIGASIVIMGGLWVLALWRAVRRGATRPMRHAAILTGALLVTLGGIALLGQLRYGGGLVRAVVAGAGDLPILPVNPGVSRATIVLLAAMIAWAVAGAWWAQADGPTTAWLGLGAILLGIVITTGFAVASDHRSAGIPIAMGVTAGVPLVALILMRARSAGPPT